MSKGVFEYGRMQKTTLYPTDLTDEQWNLLQLALPPRKTRKSRGRPPADLRRICSALLYFVRSGCAWRLLPRDFGPWKTIYHYFWLWTKQGCWKIIHDLLREAVRKAAGKRSQPTAAILDSQTVRSADQAGERGYDAAKKKYVSLEDGLPTEFALAEERYCHFTLITFAFRNLKPLWSFRVCTDSRL